MSFLKNNKGFTLLEVIISTTIFIIMLAGAYSMLNETLRFWQYGSENIDMQQNARIALTMIEYDVKRAQTVQVIPPGSIGSMLKLEIFDGGRIKTIAYYLRGVQLQKAVAGMGHNPVAYNVTELNFKGIDIDGDEQPDLIKIYMEFSTDKVFYNLSSQAHVRQSGFD